MTEENKLKESKIINMNKAEIDELQNRRKIG